MEPAGANFNTREKPYPPSGTRNSFRLIPINASAKEKLPTAVSYRAAAEKRAVRDASPYVGGGFPYAPLVKFCLEVAV